MNEKEQNQYRFLFWDGLEISLRRTVPETNFKRALEEYTRHAKGLGLNLSYEFWERIKSNDGSFISKFSEVIYVK